MANKNTEEHLKQQQLVEQLVTALNTELPKVADELLYRAGRLALESVGQGFGHQQGNYPSFTDSVNAARHEANRTRREALALKGKAEGIREIQTTLFGAMALVKQENKTLDEYLDALRLVMRKRMAELEKSVGIAMLDFIQYTESHPEFGPRQAFALAMQGKQESPGEVCRVASDLAEKIKKQPESAA